MALVCDAPSIIVVFAKERRKCFVVADVYLCVTRRELEKLHKRGTN